MKTKSLLIAAALLISTGAFAENYTVSSIKNLTDNYWVGAAAGLNYSCDGLYGGKLHGDGTFNFNVNFGKWITPEIGLEIGYIGCKAGTEDVHNFHNIYVEGLWDVTTTFGGFKPERILTVAPYIHAGYVNSDGRGAMLGAGVKLPIRIAEHFNIVPDLRLGGTSDATYNADNGGGVAASAWALLGIQYILRPVDLGAVAAVTAAEAAAAVAAAKAASEKAESDKDAAVEENKALAAQNAALADALGKDTADIAAALKNTPACVYFEINQAVLSRKELAHLEYLVNVLLLQGKNLTFTLAGNCDSVTGTPAYNQKLSQKRADYIINLLTKKFGLAADQFEVVANGGNDVFATPELNRAAIITVK